MDMQKMEEPGDNLGNRDAMTEYEEVNRVLPVPLTTQEMLQLAQDIAAAQEKAEHAERDKKAADEEYKGIIDGAYADVSQGTARLRRGKKDVEVKCEILRNYREGIIKVTRLDSMEVIENRPMNSQERQMVITFPKEGKKKKETVQ